MAEKRYWEKEEPEVTTVSKNVIKHYPNAGQVQVCVRADWAQTGVSKVATLDLEAASEDELKEMRKALNRAIDKQITKKQKAAQPA
jgi:hypothetical protein